MQVTPGIRELEGNYVNYLGRVEPWHAYYDEYGRLIGRTGYNAGNADAGIPDTHYHAFEYGPGYSRYREISRIPGAFKP